MTERIPAATEPWYSNERQGWMVGGLEVAWWGIYCEERSRLPVRWQSVPDGSGQVEPTDFEIECFVHLASHEQARLSQHPHFGTELELLADCLNLDQPMPDEAITAHGHTLVGWCPGISWHWPDENVPKDMQRSRAAQLLRRSG